MGDAVAAVASAAGTGVAVAGVGRWPPPARGSAGPVAMEDFIVISDDSGSESSAGTRSGRARRLRRALSRTPGALPRRTVVSERAAARHAPRAPGVATPVPRRRVFPPLAASGLEERGGAAGTAGLGLASAQPHQGCAAERAEHMGGRHTEHQGGLPCSGRRWPPARGGTRAFGSGEEVGIPARPQPPPDLEAGARERVIVRLVMGTDVCREVTGAPAASEGSAALGTEAAALQGLLSEPGARFLSCGEGRFISLCRYESRTKPGGGALTPLFFLKILHLCPYS